MFQVDRTILCPCESEHRRRRERTEEMAVGRAKAQGRRMRGLLSPDLQDMSKSQGRILTGTVTDDRHCDGWQAL